jgi:hypothetical protein
LAEVEVWGKAEVWAAAVGWGEVGVEDEKSWATAAVFERLGPIDERQRRKETR